MIKSTQIGQDNWKMIYWTVFGTAQSLHSVQWIKSILLIVNENRASLSTACCYGNSSPRHWRTPKALLAQTGEMLKCKSNQAYPSLFS